MTVGRYASTLPWAAGIVAEANRLVRLGVTRRLAWCRAAGVDPDPADDTCADPVRPGEPVRPAVLAWFGAHPEPITIARLADALCVDQPHLRKVMYRAMRDELVVRTGERPILWTATGRPDVRRHLGPVPVAGIAIRAWLEAHPGPATSAEIAEAIGMPVSSVSNALRRGVAQGLCLRVGVRPNPNCRQTTLWGLA